MSLKSLREAAIGFYQRHPRTVEFAAAAGVLAGMMWVGRPAEASECMPETNISTETESALQQDGASEIQLKNGSLCTVRFVP